MGNPYKDYQPPASEGGLFHKFEDGVTYVFRLASEAVVFNTEFVAPNGESNISTKYAWTAWNVAEKKAQVLQLPVTAYRQIAALATDDEYGDPTKYSLKITRTGTGVETKYSVVPSPNKTELKDLDPEAPAECSKIDLIDIQRKGKGNSQVMWLSEAAAGTKQDTSHADTKAVQDVMMNDDQAPIDLSKIPF